MCCRLLQGADQSGLLFQLADPILGRPLCRQTDAQEWTSRIPTGRRFHEGDS